MPLVSDRTPRWRNVAGLVLLLAIFGVVIYLASLVTGQNGAVNATRDSVERTDCARRVNAEQSAIRDRATIADRAERRYLDQVLLDQATSGRPSAEQTAQRVAEFSQLVQMADDADKAVATLPDPAKEVERRCPG